MSPPAFRARSQPARLARMSPRTSPPARAGDAPLRSPPRGSARRGPRHRSDPDVPPNFFLGVSAAEATRSARVRQVFTVRTRFQALARRSLVAEPAGDVAPYDRLRLPRRRARRGPRRPRRPGAPGGGNAHGPPARTSTRYDDPTPHSRGLPDRRDGTPLDTMGRASRDAPAREKQDLPVRRKTNPRAASRATE